MSLKKNNIRSIRFSDELLEIIEQQVGRNFTEKFERLIYNCYMLSSQKEEEIRRLDAQIEQRRKKLRDVQTKLSRLWPLIDRIENLLVCVDHLLDDYIEGEM